MIIHGDATQIPLADNSVDTCITDPPYHLTSITKRFGKENSAPAKYGKDGAFARASAGFMGKTWDGGNVAFNPATWTEVYRVLKPGAIMLAFGGTRTYHRLVCAIEDAGFEIRDTIAWVYGSGFPKSYDISKGIDKRAGAEREIIGWHSTHINRQNTENWNKSARPMTHSKFKTENSNTSGGGLTPIAPPSTPEAQLWHGWGTALKPAMELICVAMKPIDGTYVNNALTWGVAGLWVDGGRVGTDEINLHGNGGNVFGGGKSETNYHTVTGRFPANVIHDGSDEVTGLMPDAARFFYCAKASRSERNAGLEGMEAQRKAGAEFRPNHMEKAMNGEDGNPYGRWGMTQNNHPTVKPLALMRYLARLTKTPTGGVVLDPFMGSGTTGCAAVLEGRDFIGIELDEKWVDVARRRIAYWQAQVVPETLPLEMAVMAQ